MNPYRENAKEQGEVKTLPYPCLECHVGEGVRRGYRLKLAVTNQKEPHKHYVCYVCGDTW